MNETIDSEAAEKNWKAIAIQAVEYVCRERADFTTDQVWDRLKEVGAPPCREHRAVAGVLREAQRRGWCELTTYYSTSTHKQCHGCPRRVRVSKLFAPGA